jgi:predicted dehydrogenase
MTNDHDKAEASTAVDPGRRKVLGAVGAGAVASAFPGVFAGIPVHASDAGGRPLRWGIVGTGWIANMMAPMIQRAAGAELAAVASRRLETATQFANQHGISGTYDSWPAMLASDSIDAVYVATPTSAREEICVAAAASGKHVLGEKPFANLASLRRITSACREHGVGFMDGTHFVHHPRTAKIKASMQAQIGWPWSIDSAFQFGLSDTNNIRYNPALEPYGAIGDAGWYNMRAAAEFTAPDVHIIGVDAYGRREKETNAVMTGAGVLAFSDGSTTTWNCSFDAGAFNMDLRLSGAGGQIVLNDFVSNQGDGPAAYEYRKGGFSADAIQRIETPSSQPAAALMFEDFTAMVGNPELLAASIAASERTQEWLDAIWNKAMENEKP